MFTNKVKHQYLKQFKEIKGWGGGGGGGKTQTPKENEQIEISAKRQTAFLSHKTDANSDFPRASF